MDTYVRSTPYGVGFNIIKRIFEVLLAKNSALSRVSSLNLSFN